MNNDFVNSGYWAVILGGSSGLGLATAQKLARAGMNICIIHRDGRSDMETIQKSFDKIKSGGIRFLSVNADAGNPQKQKDIIKNLKDTLGKGEKVRTLVHSIAKGNLKAMYSPGTPELNKDDFVITIENMALSLYDWTKALFGEKLFAPDARIISFTSEGNKKAYRHYGAVSAAKATLEAITRNIALELATFGIRANCIMAGFVDTKSSRMIPGSDEMNKTALNKNPFKRITTPDDIANVVYLLCKDEAAWINGAVIPVDGGEHIA